MYLPHCHYCGSVSSADKALSCDTELYTQAMERSPMPLLSLHLPWTVPPLVYFLIFTFSFLTILCTGILVVIATWSSLVRCRLAVYLKHGAGELSSNRTLGKEWETSSENIPTICGTSFHCCRVLVSHNFRARACQICPWNMKGKLKHCSPAAKIPWRDGETGVAHTNLQYTVWNALWPHGMFSGCGCVYTFWILASWYSRNLHCLKNLVFVCSGRIQVHTVNA